MTINATTVTPEGPAAANTRDRKAMAIRAVLWIVGVAILYRLPLLLSKPDVVKLTGIGCFAIAALGLNLLTGYNGQISVGHGAFFGIGAYTTAILVTNNGWSPLGTLLPAAIISLIVGMIVGLPALRIRGVYLALVTLALATMFPQIVIKYNDLTGGTQGLDFEPDQELSAPSWSGLKDNQWRYYVVIVVAVIAFLLVRNLVRSRVGRALVAMRDNETAAEVVGVNLSLYKVMTFGVSAMLAGIGGSLYTMNSSHVDANEFGVTLSITILVMVVVGGAATTFGPAIGAFVVVMLPELFPASVPKVLTPAVFGLLLILLMAVAPGGIVGLTKQAIAWVRSRVGGSSPPVDPIDAGGEPPSTAPVSRS